MLETLSQSSDDIPIDTDDENDQLELMSDSVQTTSGAPTLQLHEQPYSL